MTDVYWLEQTEANVPMEDDWLSESETACLGGLTDRKGRAEWRLGRWTVKRAVAACRKLPLGADALKHVRISISHRAGTAVCSLVVSDAALACNLELIEPRSFAFTADYFTTEEQVLVSRSSAADRPRLIALISSAKASALKLVPTGLRADTRSVAVSPTEVVRRCGQCGVDTWRPLEVRHTGGQSYHGWWRHTGILLLTLVAQPPPGAPILLEDRVG